MRAPNLTFFVELPSRDLCDLFDTPGVIEFLADGGHGLSVGMLDLDGARAEVLRTLRARGIPVTAWLLLSEADGYWMNADNAAAAAARYRALDAWARDEGLALERVGLDVEPPRQHLERLLREPLTALLEHLSEPRPLDALRAAEGAYAALARDIHRDGREVETYQLTALLDEREAGSSLARRAFGLVDVPSDAEVFMAYASYLGSALARAYYPSCERIAVGVSGGGVHAADDELEPKLTWGQLRDELLAASRHSGELYVFSLEGCVWNDMLGALARLDWTAEPSPVSVAQAREARRARRLIRWVLSHEGALERLLPVLSAHTPSWLHRLLSRAP